MERVCVPIVETAVGKALEAIQKANQIADLIELRVDYLKDPEIGTLLEAKRKPLIVTNRRKEEGGKYRGSESERLLILKEALDQGPEYVDVEMGTERRLLQDLMADRKKAKFVLSFHDFQRTPSQEELRKTCDRMTRFKADVLKIVTFAKSWEDNLRVLSLIPYARGKKQAIVAFCMGEKGKMSRIFSPFMGAAWTYGSLNKRKTSAPGQLTVFELKEIWEKLR